MSRTLRFLIAVGLVVSGALSVQGQEPKVQPHQADETEALKAEIDKLKKTLEASKEALRDHQKKSAKLEQEIAELKVKQAQELRDREVLINQLAAEMANLQNILRDFGKQITDLAKNLAIEKNKSQQLEKENLQLKKQLEDRKEKPKKATKQPNPKDAGQEKNIRGLSSAASGVTDATPLAGSSVTSRNRE